MPLVIGAHLGPYEIIAPLGSGGMGEVYRARDSRLGRDVAIKVSAERFSDRFAREARAVAALNHPNICTLHDIGPDYLVMELVDGITLEEHLRQSFGPNPSGSSEASATGHKSAPLSVEEALRLAYQIADALEAAHARGVVHRDLKPANIKLRPDGTVKVLDFGLATLDAGGVGAEGADLSRSPTMMASMPGMIVGTAAYMAPEQARGAAVDKRADNWAFGVVLFEMLTGRRLFARPTVADTIAAVLHDEPDWSQVPAKARRLVRSCLQKEPQHRLHDIADARLLIDDDRPDAAPLPRSRLGWMVAAAFALLAAGVAVGAVWAPWRTAARAAEPVRFEIAPKVTLAASGASAISPDGRHLAFIGSGADGVLRVWIRDLDSLVDRPLPGSEVGQAAPPPFWSPDSRFIAFDAGGKLKKVDVSGGLAQTVCDVPSAAVGGSWNRDGVIIFGNVAGGIMRVSDGGGTPSPITVVDPSRNENRHLTPVFLPDGRRFLYLRASSSTPERTGIFVGSLDAKPEAQDTRRLLATTSSVVYVPAADGPGTLLFLRDANLMAQTFDDRRLELSGVPALMAERVDSYRDTATMSASDTGVLVYRGAADLQLTWLDRQGRVVGRVREPGPYQSVNLSPDGARGIVSKVSSQVSSTADLWLFDFARDTSTRFTTADADDAVWSPDGSRIVFGSELGGLLYQKPTAGRQGQAALYKTAENRVSPTSWSRDGRFLMYTALDPKTSSDLWVLSLDDQPRAVPFLRTESAESQAQFSPDPRRAPRWVAYTSNESGRNDVAVRTFPDAGNQEIVSRSGGHSPRWRGDGRELFYVAADGMIVAVPFDDGPSRAGSPTPLFQAPRGFASRDSTGSRAAAPWDVTPDGQRFLFAAPAEAGGLTQFTVVLNWRAGLKK